MFLQGSKYYKMRVKFEGTLPLESDFGLNCSLLLKDHQKPAVVIRTTNCELDCWSSLKPYESFTQKGETLFITQSVMFLNISYLYKCFT